MTIGHNSKRVKAGPVNADRLKSFVERIERLEEERKAIGGDIRDVYAEAKGVGYDVKTMRKVVSLRGMDVADRAAQQDLLDTYMYALGMVDRIDARLAAGESQRAIAEAEGVSKTTVQRRGPILAAQNAPSKMDHHPETGEISDGRQDGRETNGSAFGDSARVERSIDPVSAVLAGRDESDRQSVDGATETPAAEEIDNLDIPSFLRRVQA